MRILHTMIRVVDLEKSIKFYTDVLGMKLLRRNGYPGGKFTLAFLGFGDESKEAVIELTHNWEKDTYDMGNAFGHIAIEVDDVYTACDEIKSRGGKITYGPQIMEHGSSALAFVEDPDGYQIELLSDKRKD